MSIDSTFLMNDTDRSAMYAKVERYFSEQCGVCEQEKDADIYWPSSTSRWAHGKCLAVVTPAESNLITTIHALFKDNRRKQNTAHVLATKAVKDQCTPLTISAYTTKHGVEAIAKLFNTVGVDAVKRLAALMRKTEECEDSQMIKFATTSITEFGFAKL